VARSPVCSLARDGGDQQGRKAPGLLLERGRQRQALGHAAQYIEQQLPPRAGLLLGRQCLERLGHRQAGGDQRRQLVREGRDVQALAARPETRRAGARRAEPHRAAQHLHTVTRDRGPCGGGISRAHLDAAQDPSGGAHDEFEQR
jgi:hypothetical protein